MLLGGELNENYNEQSQQSAAGYFDDAGNTLLQISQPALHDAHCKINRRRVRC